MPEPRPESRRKARLPARTPPSPRRGDPDLLAIRKLAVTIEEAAQMVGVSRTTMYKAVRRGDIASFTVGRARRIAIPALEAFAGIPRAG